MCAASSELRSRTVRNRRGSASVELAVCLPVLVLITLGSIEATNAIFLKEHLTAAAYEGVRRATTPGKTSDDATTAAQAVLTQFGVAGGSITVTPAVGTATASGTEVMVSVTAPFSSNSCMKAFIIGKVISDVNAKAVMIHQ